MLEQPPALDERDGLPGKWLSSILGAALLPVGFAIRDEAFRQTIRYTVQGIALLLIFNAAIRDASFARRLLDSPPLRWIALLAYTLHLVHAIFVAAAEPWSESIGTIAASTIAILASLAVAWVVRLGIERPLAAWSKGSERIWRTAADGEYGEGRHLATVERR